MFDNIAGIYEHYGQMMKYLKKNEYKKNMYEFRVEHGAQFQEMVDYVKNAENREEAADHVGQMYTDKVFDLFAKRGRVPSAKRADLSFFMIYYIFPVILLTEDENASLVCDKLCAAWNEKFEQKITYTDYDTIYNGFRDKLFGIF